MSKPEDNDEPFLSRWARRKRDVAQGRVDEVHGDDRASNNAPDAEEKAGEAKAKSEEPELDLSTLPKVEELTAESDFTVFLDKRVPAFLRNAALGRMWSLDPTIRDFIEVAENQWNWNVPGGAPFYEEILTAPGEAIQSIAQAGGEVGKALFGSDAVAGAGEAAAGTASAGLRLKDDTREVEDVSGNAAMQNEGQTSDEIAVMAGPAVSSRVSMPSLEDHGDAAPQKSGANALEPRRRHGRALPV